MAINEIPRTGHITLHYKLVGSNSDPNHQEYRSDNPWQKMNTLRDELQQPGSSAAKTVGAELFATPDNSVWRLELTGEVTSASLQESAKELLKLIDSKLNLRPDDDIRAIIADSTGVMKEWQLVRSNP